MRILIAPGRFGDLAPNDAAAAIATGWARTAPADALESAPQSDGGAGLVAALIATVADPFTVQVPGEGSPTEVSAARLRSDGTVVIEAAVACAVLGKQDSSGLGRTLGAFADAGVPRIAVGLDSATTPLDGGRGALLGLAGETESPARPDIDPAVALDHAAERLNRTRLEVVCDEDRVLLGLQGCCAGAVETRGWSRAAAQEEERRMGEWVDAVRRSRPDPIELLTGRPRRTDRLAGAGAGGGLGYLLAVLGGRLEPGPAWVARRTDLAARAARSDLVVGATTLYDWRQLRHSVPEEVARAAGAAARPAILLSGRTEVGRRETMSLGFAGTYALRSSGMSFPGRGAGTDREDDHDVAALGALAARVARTWSPTTR